MDMIDLRSILVTLGLVLCASAAAMLLPALVDFADLNSDWTVFVASAAVTFFAGGLLTLVGSGPSSRVVSLKTGFILTTTVWIVATAFAALPFVGVGLSYTDAYFEAMSGLTTTGSTVLSRLDNLPRGILLWRSVLQLIGGVGIIVTAINMLPFLRIGGMQLFATESSDNTEKILPRSVELTLAIAAIYAALVAACAAAYLAFGMTGFDAICHAFTTVSTGGFSTHDLSFGFFQSPALQWICVLFMILGSLPFLVIYKAWHTRNINLLQDQQVRGFLVLLAAAIAIMAFYLAVRDGLTLEVAVRKSAFNVVSIVSTTGFATEDYTQWGPFAIGIFFVLMFVGGCSGSTAGGIKIYRLQITWLLTNAHLAQLVSPRRVTSPVYNSRALDDDIAFSVVAFLFVYIISVLCFAVLLSASGLDMTTAFSSSAQAIASVGPGMGDVVGPAGNFAPLPATAKWLLSFEMLLGRLELFTVLVLFRAEFWAW
jgi:trk/ktr system potassium uptake protein